MQSLAQIISCNAINYGNGVQAVANELGLTSALDLYCIDRILLRIHRVTDAAFDSKSTPNVEQQLLQLVHLSPTERICFVLHLEYGYLLKSLAGATFDVREIESSSIVIPNTKHWNNCRMGDAFYDKHALSASIPTCVVRGQTAGRFKLVDGYHRYALSIRAGQTTILAIVGT